MDVATLRTGALHHNWLFVRVEICENHASWCYWSGCKWQLVTENICSDCFSFTDYHLCIWTSVTRSTMLRFWNLKPTALKHYNTEYASYFNYKSDLSSPLKMTSLPISNTNKKNPPCYRNKLSTPKSAVFSYLILNGSGALILTLK